MNNKKIHFSAVILSLLATGAVAQETFELDDIIISAGNSPIASANLATSYTVITRDDLEGTIDRNIGQILRAVPGLNVSSTGSASNQIRIRGGEGSHTLVLIDGIEAGGGSDDEYYFSGISASQVERIEILRGPQTVFFGPSASSGVINIITKAPTKESFTTLHVGGGKQNIIDLAHNFSIGSTQALFSAGAERDQGHDASYQNGDKDGINRETFRWRSNSTTDAGTNIRVNLRLAKENYNYDGETYSATSHLNYVVDKPYTGKRNETLGALNIKRSFDSGRSSHEISLRSTQYESSTNENSSITKTADITSRTVRYHLQRAFRGEKLEKALTSGSFIIEKSFDKNNLTPLLKREPLALGVEFRHKFPDATSFQAGYRSESSAQYETANTWKLAVSKQLSDKTTLSFDSGTGVVNPTYCEIYGGSSCYGASGNANLKPEKNISYSLGVKQVIPLADSTVKIVAFKETLTDEIKAGPWPTYYPTNLSGKSNRHGLELEFEANPSIKTSLHVNYTYLISRDADKAIEIRRPRHEIFLKGNYNLGSANEFIELTIKNVAGNRDNYPTGNWASQKMPDYTVVGLNLSWDYSGILFGAGISNLFDAHNSDSWGYRNPGRSLFLNGKIKL